MIVYGTKIKSDISFSLELSREAETRHEIALSSEVPDALKKAINGSNFIYMSHGRSVYLHSDRLIDGSSKVEQPWCFEVKEVVRFYWHGGERTIYYELDEKGDADLLAFWFIHQLLPVYMTLENMYYFVHAGAVEVEGKSILFIAPSMGGKSTLTDYFIQQGHPLVSDDKVPIYTEEGRWMAVGSHPYHRPFREYEVLGYRAGNFAQVSSPVQAFYLLEKRGAEEDIAIEEIRGLKKINQLLSQCPYALGANRSRHMRYVTNMPVGLGVFSVKIPQNIERLGEVYEAIIQHHKRGQ